MSLTTQWRRKCKLTIDSTKVGATLTNFPVYLVWSGSEATSNLPRGMVDNSNGSSAKPDGADIRFSSDEQGINELSFEIVTFAINSVPSTVRAEIHVKLPSVSNTTNTSFYVWWFNPSATAYATSATYGRNSVWSNSYVSVYHMGESSGSIIDSVGFVNGSGTGTMPSQTTGKLGNAQNFNGSSYITLSDSSSYDLTTAMSVSGWVKVTSFSEAYHPIVTKGDNTWRIQRNADLNSLSFDRSLPGGGLVQVLGAVNVNDGNFHYAVGTFNTTNGTTLYIDGAQDANSPTTTATQTFTSAVAIGTNVSHLFRKWNGIIDEVRISSASRASTWVSTEYNNQNSPNTFISVSNPVSIGTERIRIIWMPEV